MYVTASLAMATKQIRIGPYTIPERGGWWKKKTHDQSSELEYCTRNVMCVSRLLFSATKYKTPLGYLFFLFLCLRNGFFRAELFRAHEKLALSPPFIFFLIRMASHSYMLCARLVFFPLLFK
jgi:hypothetical protein